MTNLLLANSGFFVVDKLGVKILLSPIVLVETAVSTMGPKVKDYMIQNASTPTRYVYQPRTFCCHMCLCVVICKPHITITRYH